MDGLLVLIPFIILSILATIFLSIGLVRRRQMKRSHVTEGVIIKKGRFFSHMPDRAPTVKYEVNGQIYEFTSKIQQEPGIKPGTEVDVYYLPENPEKAIINTFAQRGTVFTVIGSIIGIFALFSGILPIVIMWFK